MFRAAPRYSLTGAGGFFTFGDTDMSKYLRITANAMALAHKGSGDVLVHARFVQNLCLVLMHYPELAEAENRPTEKPKEGPDLKIVT